MKAGIANGPGSGNTYRSCCSGYPRRAHRTVGTTTGTTRTGKSSDASTAKWAYGRTGVLTRALRCVARGAPDQSQCPGSGIDIWHGAGPSANSSKRSRSPHLSGRVANRDRRPSTPDRRIGCVRAGARTSDSKWPVKRIRGRTRRCRSALRPGWRPSSFWRGIRCSPKMRDRRFGTR